MGTIYDYVMNSTNEEALHELKMMETDDFLSLTKETLRRKISNSPEVFKIVDKLDAMGFFVSPASTTHHGNFKGGLFIHSFLVYKSLLNITSNLSPRLWMRSSSPEIVGLFHDLCKTDAYLPTTNEGEFMHNEMQFPLNSHALSSIIKAQQLLALTDQEILCIRWHMGPYENDWSGYDKAIKFDPQVLWTHTADMYVSKVLGV